MKSSIVIIPNSRPAYVAESCADENNNVGEVVLMPITAWRVEYSTDSGNDDACATPITTELGLPSNYAIFYSDTNQWSVPFDTWGTGMDDLLKHFQDIEDKS
ncbi:MAG: hypothetical protein GXP14_16535 [Gammaproteobacteria bacterium]|nr:hypothetical protein [Gammaproteobacteria bacterium]